MHGWNGFCRCLAITIAMMGDIACAQEETKSYTVTVDGRDVAINLGEMLTVKGQDGKDITVKLMRNPEALFSGRNFSFRHSSDYQVATTAAADDIDQHLIVTGLGTLVLVQEYRFSDPTSLTQFMMSELTADDVLGGGTVETVKHSRNLSDGSTLSGLKARVKTAGDEAELEILAAKTKEGGIIAVSRIDLENVEAEQAFVEKFWSTLILK